MMVFDNRQGDLYLFSTLDGGNIKVENGEPVMDQGFESAVYISLEGADEPWFANEFLLPNQQIKSRFAEYRKAQPLTSGIINTSIDLIKQDLHWLIDTKAADEIIADMTIVSRNRVEISVEIRIGQENVTISPFQLNWGAQQNNPASKRV
jgi:phage gp46-like protein